MWIRRDNKHPCNKERSPNQFVFQYVFRTHLANHALISQIGDAIVTNQRRATASQSRGVYYGTRLSWIRAGTRISELLPLQLQLGMLFKWWTNCLCFYWYIVWLIQLDTYYLNASAIERLIFTGALGCLTSNLKS